MILEIGVDTSKKMATVEGKTDHSQDGKGGRTLRWMCDPDGGHDSWRVKFTNGSPFEGDKTEFGGTNGSDGGVLKKINGNGPKRYKYDVRCVSGGTTYDTDPEVVLWPD